MLPSYQENFGVAVAESLAAGTPVIVSDRVNLHPDVTEAAVGAVVPPEVAPLAREIRRWTTDRPLRDAAAARARPFAFARYDGERVARRWVEHYAALRVPKASAPAD